MPLPPLTVKSIEPSEPPLQVTLDDVALKDILHATVVKVCVAVQAEVFVPAESQRPFTLH